MKGQLLNDTQVYLPLEFRPLGRFSLTVLLFLLHPFTGRVPAPSPSLSWTTLIFGVEYCQPRHWSNTDTNMLVETAAEQLVEYTCPISDYLCNVTSLLNWFYWKISACELFLFPHSILAGMCLTY